MIAKTIIDLVAALILVSTCLAATYDEGIQGDLSNDGMAPTPFALDSPSNRLAGSITLGERDYFAINLPVGAALTKIVLERYESSNARAFVGIQTGSQITLDPLGNTSDGLLGYMHFGFDQATTSDLLVDLARSIPPTFSIPLPPGNYSFWLNQTEPAATHYEFNFTTAARPVGDYNSNGHVDAADYTLWRDKLGQFVRPLGALADGNGDGAIDVKDYEVWKTAFGGENVGAAVPEPDTVRLVAFWGVALIFCGEFRAFRRAVLWFRDRAADDRSPRRFNLSGATR